jgi:hypothetical protein
VLRAGQFAEFVQFVAIAGQSAVEQPVVIVPVAIIGFPVITFAEFGKLLTFIEQPVVEYVEFFTVAIVQQSIIVQPVIIVSIAVIRKPIQPVPVQRRSEQRSQFGRSVKCSKQPPGE